MEPIIVALLTGKVNLSETVRPLHIDNLNVERAVRHVRRYSEEYVKEETEADATRCSVCGSAVYAKVFDSSGVRFLWRADFEKVKSNVRGWKRRAGFDKSHAVVKLFLEPRLRLCQIRHPPRSVEVKILTDSFPYRLIDIVYSDPRWIPNNITALTLQSVDCDSARVMVDVTVSDIPLRLLKEFMQRVVNERYLGGISQAIKDLMYLAVQRGKETQARL